MFKKRETIKYICEKKGKMTTLTQNCSKEVNKD